MRDIRRDLSERLSDIDRESQSLKLKIEATEQDRAATQRLLDLENVRWKAVASEAKVLESAEELDLGAYLLNLLKDGAIWNLDAIRVKAEGDGTDFGAASPGRKIHGALLNLKKRGEVKQAGNRKWRIVPKLPRSSNRLAKDKTPDPVGPSDLYTR